MPDSTPDSTPDTAPAGDYEYDLAHDDVPAPRPGAGREGRLTAESEAEDPQADYSYDQAHDVPKLRRV